MLKLTKFVFNEFGENTYIVSDSDTRKAVVVDPGMNTEAEYSLFDSYVAREGLEITQIVNTHMHLDHCFGMGFVRSRYGVAVAAHAADAPLGEGLDMQARMFGMNLPAGLKEGVQLDVELGDGDRIAVGDGSLEVIALPGHTPGGIALYSAEGHFALTGDSIFYGSIGRTDLPGGDMDSLVAALRRRILTLPDDTKLYPGHGPATTVAAEKAHNPFIR
ncbi:MAG: MBL fold metallo-hydrolase [Muribaculaceae bacterium]|nr:MBL fold metallo-hydrolase [Muribaculaceae bacterium]